jgi:hypothetical protein
MRYRAVLQAHDLGVSLMDSPHPSLVPLEMAAAGMPTVTSTFANKDAIALSALSPNLIGVTPTIEGVLEGLRRAVLCVDDVAERVAGAARLQWPRSAEQAFDSATLDRVEALVDGARAL